MKIGNIGCTNSNLRLIFETNSVATCKILEVRTRDLVILTCSHQYKYFNNLKIVKYNVGF